MGELDEFRFTTLVRQAEAERSMVLGDPAHGCCCGHDAIRSHRHGDSVPIDQSPPTEEPEA